MWIRGQQTISEVFGVSVETIVTWQREGFPVAVHGGPGVPNEYDTAECIAWMLERELRKIREESPNDRLSRVKADAIEMDNAERRKRLIPVDQIEPKLRAAMVLARESWMDVVPRLARAVRSAESYEAAEALQEAAHVEQLMRMSRWRDSQSLDEEGPD